MRYQREFVSFLVEVKDCVNHEPGGVGTGQALYDKGIPCASYSKYLILQGVG